MSHADDVSWMRQALALAHAAQELDEVPVGAIIVQDGKVVGQGFNQPITSNDPSAHAEIVALRDASKQNSNYRLPGTTLYVTIEPCTMCVGAMIHARVERLVFGAKELRSGAVCSHFNLLESDVYNHRITYEGGVMEAECSALITEFFKQRRNK